MSPNVTTFIVLASAGVLLAAEDPAPGAKINIRTADALPLRIGVVEAISENASGIAESVIYSLQSAQAGGVSSGADTAEAIVYKTLDKEPLAYSFFLNLNPSTGSLFPGAMIADNMGLGAGFTAGGEISSYDLLLFRSTLDPQPGLADFHVELWDGDPFCMFDTPGGGFSCEPIPGTEADFVDIPAGTVFTARAVLPQGVTTPNRRVWMVVSGSETANSSPCRLGWVIAYDDPVVGTTNGLDVFLTQQDETGVGACCEDGSACSVAGGMTCAGDDTGSRGFCSDGHAETPGTYTIGGSLCNSYPGAGRCSNFVASIRAPAKTTISLVPVGNGPNGQLDQGVSIDGTEMTMTRGGSTVFLEIRISDWDDSPGVCIGGPNDGLPCTIANEPVDCPRLTVRSAACGRVLRVWRVTIDSAGYTSGLQGFLTPTTTLCSSDRDCRVAFGGICSIFGSVCLDDTDCSLPPFDQCRGSRCVFPAGVGEFCEPGFILAGRGDYVFLLASGDASGVSVTTINYRYVGVVRGYAGAHPVDPFPPGGAYAGTLVLDVSADAEGTFTVGMFPLTTTFLQDQTTQFMPLVALVPAKITVEIGQCCHGIGTAEEGCIDGVIFDQCLAQPRPVHFVPWKTCADECIACFPSSPPRAERVALSSGGSSVSTKNRYLSFEAGDPGHQQAIRVTFNDLPPPHDAWNGVTMWVGEPREVSEHSGSLLPSQAPHHPTWVAATLQCDPVFVDWAPLGTIHVYHDAIVPGGAYGASIIDEGCALNIESNFSAPLGLTTSRWGDVVKNCATTPCGPPDGSVNITTDVLALVDKFRNQPGAPIKARCDLAPALPDQIITITDITYCIDAFRGWPYPFPPASGNCP